MTRFHEKVEGRVKQMVGEMIGDHQLVHEGAEQLRKADLKPVSAGDASAHDPADRRHDEMTRRA